MSPFKVSHETDPADGGELRRVLRSLIRMDGTLVLLALLVALVAPGAVPDRDLYLAAIAVYATLVLTLRYAPFAGSRVREKRILGAAGMVLFITCALALSGGERGPLLNLYLLPVVTAALTLGRGATLLILALVLGSRVSLSHFAGGLDVLTLGYGLTLLTEALPVMLVALLTSALAEDVQQANERLRAMADQDDLTGVLNLQAFTRLMEAELERSERRGNSLALLIVDVDGLRPLNERFGHEAGNRALKALAPALQRSVRSVDLVARYGGDEFVVFLSGAGSAVARAVANRIRHNVATTTHEFGGSLHRVTVSVGAAIFPADGRELRDLMNKAVAALKKDKDSRRPLQQVVAQP
jgi:diguanylate cyclase (GGDEF)-like protein